VLVVVWFENIAKAVKVLDWAGMFTFCVRHKAVCDLLGRF
jgi:hypothetical protein